MDVDGNPAAAAGRQTFAQQRTSTPYDDYDNAAEALYAAWWPLIPLRQGLRRGKAISDKKWRHLWLCEDEPSFECAPQTTLLLPNLSFSFRGNAPLPQITTTGSRTT